MPDSQQIPESRWTGLPRVLYTPRSNALLLESWARVFEAGRFRWAVNDPQQSSEAYASGEPCRACRRALLGESALGADEESLALIDADNAKFRIEHEACRMGVWHLENHRVEHCHVCCPFPPLSLTQYDKLWQLLRSHSGHVDRSATWRVELTCRHVETLDSSSARYVVSTLRCAECAATRGVVKAVRIDDRSENGANTGSLDCLQPEYQRLTDEQRSRIKHIVHTEDGPHRGRPRTDMRTIVDAALYKVHTRIAWRELPAEFGSWQTASRRHRQLIAGYQWLEITQVLAVRDPSKGRLDF